MADHEVFQDLLARASFHPTEAQKLDAFRSERLFVGLNCLGRGQAQRVHTHDSADKFYLVIHGKARITIGAESRDLAPGSMAWAPAGVPHGIAEALEDTVIVVVMAPPPAGRHG